jgi:hypothetical protein
MDAAAAVSLLLFVTPSPAMDEANLSIDLTIDPCFSEVAFFVFWLDCGVGGAAETSLAFLLKNYWCSSRLLLLLLLQLSSRRLLLQESRLLLLLLQCRTAS